MELPRFKLDQRTTSLTPLFLNESARSISVSLLSFFSTLYIYKKIFEASSDQTLAFLFAFIFFIILHFLKIIGTFAAENLALKVGLKIQLVLGNLLTMAAIGAFYLSEKNLNFLFLASCLWGLAIGFFWFGRHGLLAKTGEQGEYGEALGWAGIINSFFILGVPFLGGFLISRFSYQALFLVSFLIMFLGFLPLFRLKDQKTHQDAFWQEVFSLFWSHKRMFLAYFALGAVGPIYSLGLILYIFLFLGKELVFGEFFSLSLLLVAMVNFLVGKWTDKKGKKGLVSYGAFLSSFSWLGRFLATSIPALLIFDVIDRIAGGMVGIPMMVLTFEKASDGGSTGRALIFREIALGLGAIFSIFLLSIIVVLGFPLKSSFLVASLLMLSPLLIVKNALSSVSKKSFNPKEK